MGLHLDGGVRCMMRRPLKLKPKISSKNYSMKNQLLFTRGSPCWVPTLPVKARNNLIAPVTMEETRRAIMSMKSYKAPGPDGFQPIFFKQFWDVVEKIFGGLLLQPLPLVILMKDWQRH